MKRVDDQQPATPTDSQSHGDKPRESDTPRTDKLVRGGAWGQGYEKRSCTDEALAIAWRIIGTNSRPDPYTLALWIDHAWALERCARSADMASIDTLDWNRLRSGDRRALNPDNQPLFDRFFVQSATEECYTPSKAALLISYIDALFVSGNDKDTTTTLFSKASWDIIKEMLAEGLPLDYHIVESEAVYRRKLAAYGDETRATSPLVAYRTTHNPADRKANG